MLERVIRVRQRNRRITILPAGEICKSLARRMQTRIMPFIRRVSAQRGIRGVRKGERIRQEV